MFRPHVGHHHATLITEEQEINNKNNDVPKGTEDNMYNAMVSPVISVAG
jgi:hypothetical protein